MFEYRVIPAPNRGQKAKGLRTPADRFSNALEQKLNELAVEGWEYVRADTLPSEERQGLKGRKTVYQSVMVFRRPLDTSTTYMDEPPVTAPVEPEPTYEVEETSIEDTPAESWDTPTEDEETSRHD